MPMYGIVGMCCRFGEEDDSDEGGVEYDWEEGDDEGVAHVPVPTQKEVEQMLIRRKKKVCYEIHETFIHIILLLSWKFGSTCT